MRHIDWETVRALPLFQDISEAHFAELMTAAFLQRFPQNVTLINEGELPDFLHVVVDGTVELFGSHAGRHTTVGIIGPIATFILAAVIRDEPYLKSARTLTPARILMIPAGTVRALFDQDTAFANAIVNELANRYRGVIRTLKDERLRTSAQRLANWILRAQVQQGGKHRIELKFDKRALASHLGMTPESLARNLALLTNYGVRSSGREIFIKNQKALERFAEPNVLIDG